MKKVLRNILAILVGIAVGGLVNMALVTLSPLFFAPPLGVDGTDAQNLSRAIHLFEPRHFFMPFLAHALGTLVGALVAYLIATTYREQLAYVIGVFFLCGGVVASFMIPAPFWFIALDLILAYLPMAWLGIKVGSSLQRRKNASQQSP